MAAPEPIHITIDEDALKKQIGGALNETMSEFGARLRTAAAVLDPVGEQNMRDWTDQRIEKETAGGKAAVVALRKIRSIHSIGSLHASDRGEVCTGCGQKFPCPTRKLIDEALP